jgi:hypothetical protein
VVQQGSRRLMTEDGRTQGDDAFRHHSSVDGRYGEVSMWISVLKMG